MSRQQKSYFVYILASDRGVLYTGVTGNLSRRMVEHRMDIIRGFTARYKVHRLVYYEEATDIRAAIAREKQIKAGRREKAGPDPRCESPI